MTFPKVLMNSLLEEKKAGNLKPECLAMTDEDFEDWMEKQYQKELEAEKRREERGDLLKPL